ncbi:epsilon-sarcoglycan-like isoform X2 [Anneissia japonica]|uniref:epsilon-sarcoglycan-like isoform X2 n=1 Tax=Anneissia japonica TaxID=1529436 RepID=UPI00142584AD|nr:epsilon-sarcoglycan-like isoform X2 [Anneissia japonica]
MELVFLLVTSFFIVSAKKSATVGNSFHYVIYRSIFAFQNLENSNPITFRPSLDGKAGLPSWLKYYQEDTTENGFLYGTPQLSDVGNTNLEIIALNRATYKTARVELVITVQDNTDSADFLAAFNVTNKNLTEMLTNPEQESFLQKTSVIWETANNLFIYNIGSSGKRNPSPENSDQYEGVIVTVGSSSPFSTKLTEGYEVLNCNSTVNESLSSDTQMETWNQIFATEFVIDWCYFNLTNVEEEATPTPLFLGGDFDSHVYNPGRLRDIRRSFYMIVIFPIALAFLFSCLLGYLMFCRREGVVKRNVNTPEEQLIYHKNIKRSTKDLRKMNNRRNNAGTMFSPYTGSPNSIYQPRLRSNRPSEEEPLTSSPAANPETSPPIYRLPPFSTDRQETSFMYI